MSERWMEGYALAQQAHNEVNWAVTGLDDIPDLIAERVARKNLHERNVAYFLRWIKGNFGLRIFYYPMCGWHITPREVFGIGSVVHLSNDDKHPYLQNIGEGIRVKGDIYRQPFREGVFDAVYLRGQDLPRDTVVQGMEELRRVVIEDGLFVIELSPRTRNIARYAKDHLQLASIPDNIKAATRKYFGLYVNKVREEREKSWLPKWLNWFGR